MAFDTICSGYAIKGDPGPPGPEGPPGPTAVSTDPGNQAELGSDGLVYVPASVGDQTGTVFSAGPVVVTTGPEQAPFSGGGGLVPGVEVVPGGSARVLTAGVWTVAGQLLVSSSDVDPGVFTHRVWLRVTDQFGVFETEPTVRELVLTSGEVVEVRFSYSLSLDAGTLVELVVFDNAADIEVTSQGRCAFALVLREELQ